MRSRNNDLMDGRYIRIYRIISTVLLSFPRIREIDYYTHKYAALANVVERVEVAFRPLLCHWHAIQTFRAKGEKESLKETSAHNAGRRLESCVSSLVSATP